MKQGILKLVVWFIVFVLGVLVIHLYGINRLEYLKHLAQESYLNKTITPSCSVFIVEKFISGPCDQDVGGIQNVTLQVTGVETSSFLSIFAVIVRVHAVASVVTETEVVLVPTTYATGEVFSFKTTGEDSVTLDIDLRLPWPPSPGLRNMLYLQVDEVKIVKP